MNQKDDVIKQVHEAFDSNHYPGDSFLQGSSEGCEPYDEVGYFKGKTDWKTIDAEMLDKLENYIVKPFTPETFHEKLKKVFGA